jgi:hypothetical protein
VPDRDKIAKVLPLYDALLVEERRQTDRPTGLRASYATLEGALREQQKSYDEWVWSL